MAHILREPVLRETRENLARSWARLPAKFQTDRQMYGRQGNGCGATIGAMPRCDFACRGCYLGEDANTTPAQPVEEIKRQMRLLRPLLGNAGNLQLTDGEITLRPEHELIELIRYANELGLVPMVMTHGDSFRRRPGLLERLIVEGGLAEVSIHVDTTQRGRKGAAYKYALTEAELNPLRDEFAEMIRAAKRSTGRLLRCATTMTVTRENLSGVADVVRWLSYNADAFRLISFQPVAQVGRTEDGLGGGVSVEEVWAEVARGLDGLAGAAERLARGEKWLGHPGCNRFVHGVVSRRVGETPRFHPVREEGDPVDARVVDEFLRRFGGLSFRRDSRLEIVTRMIALLLRAPLFAARHAVPYALHWLRRLRPGHPGRALIDLVTRRLRINGLLFISHHFMSKAEIETADGQERLNLCVFKLVMGETATSMCEVNALGGRDRYYATLERQARRGAREEAMAASAD
jgi:hypothetical protein